MDSSLRRRLLDAPHLFLRALSSGGTALDHFEQGWQRLHSDMNAIFTTSNMSPEEKALVHSVVSQVANIADGLTKVLAESQRLTSSLMVEVVARFSDLTLSERSAKKRRYAPYHLDSESDSALPPHIPCAYSWFLANVHNPFPTLATRKVLSTWSGIPLQNITQWFQHVRRHVGWTRLCKSHFNGVRIVTVETFSRFLDGTPSSPPLSPHVISALKDVKRRSENLYAVGQSPGSLLGYETTFEPPTTIHSRFPMSSSWDVPEAQFRLSPTPSLISCSTDESEADQSRSHLGLHDYEAKAIQSECNDGYLAPPSDDPV